MSISVVNFASNKKEIYNAYISGKMDKWKNIIDQMEGQKIKTNSFLIELINYQYGYIGWCLGNNKKNQAKKYLNLAEKNLEVVENQQCCFSLIYAYKSAFYGFRIGLTPYKAPFIGPNSMKNAELSIETDSTNFLGFVQYGNNQFYMPAVFGGSKELAIDYFEKAKALLEHNQNELIYDWNYLSLMVVIAQAYEKIKDLEMAKEYYEIILKKEPDFIWVKDELYPDLLIKIEAKK
jgi:hypothetical protein